MVVYVLALAMMMMPAADGGDAPSPPARSETGPAASADPPIPMPSDEDVLWLFQSVAALAAASTAGAAVMVPGALVLGSLVAVSAIAGSPVVLVIGAGAVLAVALAVQGAAAGMAVWGLSLVGDRYRARTFLPAAAETRLRSWVGEGAPRDEDGADVVVPLVGGGWFPGAAGYLVGAVAGLGMGLAAAAPLLLGSLALAQAPGGGVSGPFAVVAALAVAVGAPMLGVMVLGPATAALAHQLSKVPSESRTPRKGALRRRG